MLRFDTEKMKFCTLNSDVNRDKVRCLKKSQGNIPLTDETIALLVIKETVRTLPHRSRRCLTHVWECPYSLLND